MRTISLVVATWFFAGVESAQAQIERRQHEPSAFERRASGSIGVWALQPTGELHQNIHAGWGAGAAGLLRVDDRGWWAMRLDIGLGGYGTESKRVALSPTIGGRVQVDVVTRNYVVVGGIGPQLAAPSGIVRPYVNAGLGMQVFFTQSDVEGADDDLSFANTVNHSDWTPAWTTGGGLYIPLRYGRTPVLLDLGDTYYIAGRASYLKPGSIEDLPNSQIRITPMESETPLVLVRLGVKIGR